MSSLMDPIIVPNVDQTTHNSTQHITPIHEPMVRTSGSTTPTNRSRSTSPTSPNPDLIQSANNKAKKRTRTNNKDNDIDNVSSLTQILTQSDSTQKSTIRSRSTTRNNRKHENDNN